MDKGGKWNRRVEEGFINSVWNFQKISLGQIPKALSFPAPSPENIQGLNGVEVNVGVTLVRISHQGIFVCRTAYSHDLEHHFQMHNLCNLST